MDILTKLANIYLDLNNYNWNSLPDELSYQYKNLSLQEQTEYITKYHKKIIKLIDNPADTIINYEHFKRLNKSFDEWLIFQFTRQV